MICFRHVRRPAGAIVALAAALAMGQTATTQQASAQGSSAHEEGGVRHVTPKTLTFQPFPEERGAEIAVLHGNPSEAGHYIVRIRFAANWDGRPHRHNGAELLTVHSGTWYVADGDDLDREAAVELSSGSFMALPAGTAMRAFTGDDGAVVDIQGVGPFATHYLDE
jgi:mannose-6-phosphate isomerase-like protein (cupin superfamily)